MRQDLWALQGHGQRDPLQTPAQVLEIKIVCDIIWYRREFLSIFGIRYLIMVTLHTILAYDIV